MSEEEVRACTDKFVRARKIAEYLGLLERCMIEAESYVDSGKYLVDDLKKILIEEQAECL